MRKLGIFSLAFAVAAAAYVYLFSPTVGLSLAAFSLLVAVLFVFIHSDYAKRIRIFAFGLSLGLFWSWAYGQLHIKPVAAVEGENQKLTVRVWDFPEETDYGCRVLCKLEKGKILLYLDCAAEALSPGDRLTVQADVIDVSKGSKDENNLYYQSRDISLLGFQRDELEIQEAESLPLTAYPVVFGRWLRQSVAEAFPKDAAGFALALVTGGRSGLTYGQQNDLAVTGISHVISVSGMHVSLLVGLAMLLCGSRRRLAAVISIFVMFFFAAMLGFTPSVTRAAIMNSVLLLAPLLGRENDPLTSLGLALFLILGFNPWAIANISLQLSFTAMVGLLLLTPYFTSLMEAPFPMEEWKNNKHILYKPVRGIIAVLSCTLGVTVTTTPISAAAFGSVSIISPLTNVLTLAVISFVFSGAFITGLIGLIFMPLAKAMGWILAWPIRYVLWVADGLADIPYAAVYTDKIYILAWLITAYLLFGIFMWQRKRCRASYLLVSLAITLTGAVLFSGLQREELILTAVDVGQGQCIIAQSGGKTVLIDCGGDLGDENGEAVARKLLMSGETRVDALILTHFDKDHMCGVAQLMKRIDVAQLYVPDIQRGDENRGFVLQKAQEEGSEVYFITAQSELSFGTGSISLFPPVDESEENVGLSALLCVKEYDILITGDMTGQQERKLLKYYEMPEVEVLVAGHHGSKYSTCAELLQATTPETVLICVGENSYGHPAGEVLERIEAIGAEVYRTDCHGDITITR